MDKTIKDYYWERECLTRFTAIIQSIFNYQFSYDYQQEYIKLEQLKEEKAREDVPDAIKIYNYYLNKHILELHQVLSNELTKNYHKGNPLAVFRTIECIKNVDTTDGVYADSAECIISSIIADTMTDQMFVDFSDYGKCTSSLLNKEFIEKIGQEASLLLPELEEIFKQISTGYCKDIADYLPKDFVKLTTILMWYYAVNDQITDNSCFSRACSLYEKFTASELFIPARRQYLQIYSVEEILSKTLHAKKVGQLSEETILWTEDFIEYCQTNKEKDLLFTGLGTLLSGLCWMGSFGLEKDVLNVMISKGIPMPELFVDRYKLLNQSSNIIDKEWSLDLVSEKESDTKEYRRHVYNYRILSLSESQTKEHFKSLSAENTTETNELVAFEWSKSININSEIQWDLYRFCEVLNVVLSEEIDEGLSCKVVEASVLNEDYLEWENAIYISDNKGDGRFPWLGFIITADIITRKKMSVALYAVYLPNKDFEGEVKVFDRNNMIYQRYLSIKNKLNPKTKNYIFTMQTIIIEEMEKFINASTDKESIY